jgi:hypothetical protein
MLEFPGGRINVGETVHGMGPKPGMQFRNILPKPTGIAKFFTPNARNALKNID